MKYIMLLVAVFMFAAGAALCYFGHTGSGATIAIGAMITMTIVFGVIEANREAREKRISSSDETPKNMERILLKYMCRVRWYEHFLARKGFTEKEFVGIDKLVDNLEFPENKERKPL